MFKLAKTFTNALITITNAICTIIGIAGKAANDASREYDDWSERRQSTKANLKEFLESQDVLEEITSRLADVESSELSDEHKELLRQQLNQELQNYLTVQSK